MTRAIRSRAARCNTATGRHLAASPPRNPLRSGMSTLDSIQCHSISQCNAHAAAYRCVSLVKRSALPALSVPRVTGASIKARALARARCEYGRRWCGPLLYTDFIFQLHFVVYSWTSPRGADLVWKTVVRRDCQRANVATTSVTIDLCARKRRDGFIE